MELLKQRILKDGIVRPGNVLKVDSFLNHQMDIGLINEIGKEFKRRFADRPVTRILTIEASGIGIACLTALHFGVPVVFAKKSRTSNLSPDVYTAKVVSFTHEQVRGALYDVAHIGLAGVFVEGYHTGVRTAGTEGYAQHLQVALELAGLTGGAVLHNIGVVELDPAAEYAD